MLHENGNVIPQSLPKTLGNLFLPSISLLCFSQLLRSSGSSLQEETLLVFCITEAKMFCLNPKIPAPKCTGQPVSPLNKPWKFLSSIRAYLTCSSCFSDGDITPRQQLSPDFPAQRWFSLLWELFSLSLWMCDHCSLSSQQSQPSPAFTPGTHLSSPSLWLLLQSFGQCWLPGWGISYPWCLRGCTSQQSEQDISLLKMEFRWSSEPYLELVLLLESTGVCRCLLVVSSQSDLIWFSQRLC